MQTNVLKIVSNEAYKGFPFTVAISGGNGQVIGLRAVMSEDENGEQKLTITYKTPMAERVIGMQSGSKKLVQFCTYFSRMMKGDEVAEEVITTPLKNGGLYKTSRRNKKGHIVGGTYAYWLEEDGILYRSNYPDIKGSRRLDERKEPKLIEREPVCTWNRRGQPVMFALPETMQKGSGFVYRTVGTNSLLSEARRAGLLED